jgi:hypothetical protein
MPGATEPLDGSLVSSGMRKKLLLSFALFGLAIASAKSYSVTLYQTAKLGQMELKAGEYRVEVVDQKAVFRNGTLHGEAPVKVETGDTRFHSTSVRLTGDGIKEIQEIRLGGTKTILKFGQ